MISENVNLTSGTDIMKIRIFLIILFSFRHWIIYLEAVVSSDDSFT